MITTTHENYNRLKALLPNLEHLSEQESVHIPLPVMDCRIFVQKQGPYISRLEVSRGIQNSEGEYIPDHKMQIHVNHHERTVEPDKIWFLFGSSDSVRDGQGVNPAKHKVLSNTLANWLDRVLSEHCIAHHA